MSKLVKIFTSFALLLCIVSCATAPTYQQQATADYGRVMTTEECIVVAEQAISYNLKDPNSAQFRHAPCTRGYWGSVPILGMPIAYGYFQQGQVNAKNALGGYVGFKGYKILMRNGQVVRYCVTDNQGTCVPVGR